MVSACITAQIDNGPKQIYKIKNADFQWIINNNPGTVTEEKMTALALLSYFFDLSPNDYWRNAVGLTESRPSFYVGQLMDNYTSMDHPHNSVSLVSFHSYSLISNLSKKIPPGFTESYNQWGNRLRGKSLSQVNTILNEYYTPGYITLSDSPKTLYIHKTSMFDLNEQSNLDGVTYIDGYEAISNCIKRNTVSNVALNKAEIGLVADYPTIIFETESSIEYNFDLEAIEIEPPLGDNAV